MSRKTVELNGKIYDAASGKVLRSVQNTDPTDRAGNSQKSETKKRKPASGSRAVHSKTQRSKTLMRRIVKKPSVSVNAKKAAKKPEVVVPHTGVDPLRLEAAKRTRRSGSISKFGSLSSQDAEPGYSTAVLDVQPEPEDSEFTLQAPVSHEAHAVKENGYPDFQKALRQATSHTQPRHKKPGRHSRVAHKMKVSPRLVSAAGISLTVLAVTGFAAAQNSAGISMKLAASRAGVNAQIPSYQPAGFSLDRPIRYGDDVVSLTYKSRSDGREFKLHQSNSEWSNQQLQQNLSAGRNDVLGASTSGQTIEVNGQIVYVDGDDATWIKDGMLYRVEGESELSNAQIIELVNGL